VKVRSEREGGGAVRGLSDFGAFLKGRELFDLVVADMSTIQDIPMCWRLVGQQVASADSICANIEEGYGRGGRAEYRHFLSIARGSAQETRGRYERMHHWLPAEAIASRIGLCDEIIGILTATMRRLSENTK
jgi:four helix bundle protein